MPEELSQRFCGCRISIQEIDEIREIVSSCHGISRTELASTICELFHWKRATGRLKMVECRQFLEDLHDKSARGFIAWIAHMVSAPLTKCLN